MLVSLTIFCTEKDNQVAVSSLFTAAMIGGISAGGILGAKAVVKYKGGKTSFYPQNRLLQECHLYFLFLCLVVRI
jgi:hypothetical protein